MGCNIDVFFYFVYLIFCFSLLSYFFLNNRTVFVWKHLGSFRLVHYSVSISPLNCLTAPQCEQTSEFKRETSASAFPCWQKAVSGCKNDAERRVGAVAISITSLLAAGSIPNNQQDSWSNALRKRYPQSKSQSWMNRGQANTCKRSAKQTREKAKSTAAQSQLSKYRKGSHDPAAGY